MERVPGNVRRREAFAGPPELARFFKGERLETMPAKASARLALLTYLVGLFERDRVYTEDEVDRLLSRVDDDFATLRRYLVDAHLLARERSAYRRV